MRKKKVYARLPDLNISLKVEKVNPLPITAVQGEHIPRLRERGAQGQLHWFHYSVQHTIEHTHTEPNTHFRNTNSPVRPGHSDRVSPHPERRRFWNTDRDGSKPLVPRIRTRALYVYKALPRIPVRPYNYTKNSAMYATLCLMSI